MINNTRTESRMRLQPLNYTGSSKKEIIQPLPKDWSKPNSDYPNKGKGFDIRPNTKIFKAKDWVRYIFTFGRM